MFTEEQSQYLENVLRSKMQDCTLEFVWEEWDKGEEHEKEEIPQKNTELLNEVRD